MTTTAQKIELLAKANDTHKLLEQARQSADFDSCARLCDVLQHEYTLLKLMEKQEQQEASWTPKLPVIEPLSPVMSAEELAKRLA
jgi:hypothetical protein